MLIGYARVSTNHQETHLQMDALQRAGVVKIYQEKASSVGKRLELQKALEAVRSGDVLVVYKIDRFARSLKDLLTILERIAAKSASIRSLTEPLDTTTPLGMFMVQVLGAVAQLEHKIIRQRVVDGQVAAIKRGQVFGRPKILDNAQELEVLRLVDQGCKKSHVAKRFGVSYMVVRRILDEQLGRKNTGRYPVLKQYL
nr:recombinase family protein [uncultured Albidiferax sp.]